MNNPRPGKSSQPSFGWFRSRALSTALLGSLLALLLSGVALELLDARSGSGFFELVQLAALCNLPLGLCLSGWVVVFRAVETGYSPGRIQIASVVLLAGTIPPVVTAFAGLRISIAVLHELGSLFWE